MVAATCGMLRQLAKSDSVKTLLVSIDGLDVLKCILETHKQSEPVCTQVLSSRPVCTSPLIHTWLRFVGYHLLILILTNDHLLSCCHPCRHPYPTAALICDRSKIRSIFGMCHLETGPNNEPILSHSVASWGCPSRTGHKEIDKNVSRRRERGGPIARAVIVLGGRTRGREHWVRTGERQTGRGSVVGTFWCTQGAQRSRSGDRRVVHRGIASRVPLRAQLSSLTAARQHTELGSTRTLVCNALAAGILEAHCCTSDLGRARPGLGKANQTRAWAPLETRTESAGTQVLGCPRKQRRQLDLPLGRQPASTPPNKASD
jgi:hypothetical protein